MPPPEKQKLPTEKFQHQVEQLLPLSDEEQFQPEEDHPLKSAENRGRTEGEQPATTRRTQSQDTAGERPGSRETGEGFASGDRGGEDGDGLEWSAWFAVGIFVHEVWVLLQHANILLNPLCQRLDRNSGESR